MSPFLKCQREESHIGLGLEGRWSRQQPVVPSMTLSFILNLPPQVPTSRTKPKGPTTRQTLTRPSSTRRAATPTRTRRKSTTSSPNRTPHSCPGLDAGLLGGGGRGGGLCRFRSTRSERSEGWRCRREVGF